MMITINKLLDVHVQLVFKARIVLKGSAPFPRPGRTRPLQLTRHTPAPSAPTGEYVTEKLASAIVWTGSLARPVSDWIVHWAATKKEFALQ